MSNQYLQYTSKDYNSIYNDLLNAIPSLTNAWTCTDDGDPGIVLLKEMAALGDMLSYNIDKQALEYYGSTVTQRKNAANVFGLVGYKMHWYRSATNTVNVTNITKVPEIFTYITTFQEANESDITEILDEFYRMYPATVDAYKVYYTYDSANQVYVPISDVNELLPILTAEYNSWATDNSIIINKWIDSSSRTLNIWGDTSYNNNYTIIPTIYETDALTVIAPNQTCGLEVVQGNLCSVNFTLEQLRDNRFYLPETAVDESYIWLKYSSSDGTSVNFIDKTDNLLTVTDAKVYFEFKIDEFDIPYIELSSYAINSLNIANGANFVLYYIQTNGAYGNITNNFLKHIEAIPPARIAITHPANNTPYINEVGLLLASPGYHPETPQQAYKNANNYVTTFNTLVTVFDFERFVKRQKGVTNCYAVDGQRALDINEQVDREIDNMSLAQLQAVIKDDSVTDISELRDIYRNRKYVRYNDYNNTEPNLSLVNPDSVEIKIFKNGQEYTTVSSSLINNRLTTYLDNYANYSLNMHVVYGNFETYITNPDGSVTTIADMSTNRTNPGIKGYWSYRIISDYDNPEVVTDDIVSTGSVAKYLDHKLSENQTVTVEPNYAPVRVFPWRCCGVLHLTQPVTEDVANQIIQLVIYRLQIAFHSSNLTFGKKISYMDVIKVVTDASDKISYFDAGLGERKLIDMDKSVDESYFNNTSLMYYYQTFENNNSAKNSDGSNNPYYKLLSVSPEYIIQS